MSIRTTSGRCRRAESNGGLAVGRLGDDVDVRLRLEDHPEAGPDERLVVGDEDPETGGGHGGRAPSRAAPGVERQPGPDGVPAADPRAGLEPPADERRAFAHPDEPPPAALARCRRPGRRRGSRPGAGRARSSRRTSVARLARVAEGVGQRLLDDAVHGHVERGRDRPRRARRSRATSASPASRTRSTSVGSAAIPGCGAIPAASSSSLRSAEEPTQLGHRVAPDRLDRRAATARPRRATVRDHLSGGAGLDDHHADRVGHDVVELAGDVPALLGGRRGFEPCLSLTQCPLLRLRASLRLDPPAHGRRRPASHVGTSTTNGSTQALDRAGVLGQEADGHQRGHEHDHERGTRPIAGALADREAGEPDGAHLDPRDGRPDARQHGPVATITRTGTGNSRRARQRDDDEDERGGHVRGRVPDRGEECRGG